MAVSEITGDLNPANSRYLPSQLRQKIENHSQKSLWTPYVADPEVGDSPRAFEDELYVSQADPEELPITTASNSETHQNATKFRHIRRKRRTTEL
ncbi:predicted protein [Arabidopsis lyrata subsp. lyrata]|uniref:Predicted protein n=1 Tax=Arabidopsis lyrata subsp. lyrata TaxID=81972 RepID=D7MGT7_ARALL|nr:predicted protein [Arabidopsis lyrata subsp. lyrata]